MNNEVVIIFIIPNGFPSVYLCLRLFFDPLVGSSFMKMHEHIRRKVYLTCSSDKSWKSSILWICFIGKADLAVFSKDFLFLSNRKQTMRTKRVCPKFSDPEIWYEVSPYRSRSMAKSHWKHICWTLNVFSKHPRKNM